MATKAKEVKEVKKSEGFSITGILVKAHLNGMTPMLRMGKAGGFEAKDSSGNILVIYKGGKDELFSEEVGIFSLGLLLDILKTMDKPKVTYKDGVMSVKEGSKAFEYMTAEPSVIFTAYAPKPGEHVLTKIKSSKSGVIELGGSAVKEILKSISVIKDASVAFIEKNVFGVGGDNENKCRIKMDKDTGIAGKVIMPKKELQEILSACEGDITIEVREDGAPVVIKEKDLTYILNQQA